MDCLGLGYQYGANLVHKPEIMGQSIAGLLRFFWMDKATSGAFTLLNAFLDAEGIDPYTSLQELPARKFKW